MVCNERIRSNLIDYTKECAEAVQKTDFEALRDIAKVILETKKTGAKIFTAGNGGSAATASHICNDLAKGCRVYDRVGFKAECLADSTAVVTCLANDFSYDEIFEIMLKTKANKGDVLLMFSGSGNSPNVVRAAEYAQKMGVTTVGFLGRDGGKLKGFCDYYVIAPTDSMEMLEDMHMLYVHALVVAVREELKLMWDMEIVNPLKNGNFKTALFDFDGTVSLIRSGWQDIMIPYFIEVLSKVAKDETEEEVTQTVRDFVDTLTGKQTIFQCMRLDEEVVKRGGEHVDPLEYKKEYLRRLEIHIKERKEGLINGTIKPEELTVPGCTDFVYALKEKGIKCYLASGTDEKDVLYEAGLLGLDKVFDGHIYGAHDYMTDCSKELVIKSLITEGGIKPEELISFGDGYVEIELVANIGGYTVGVATDEDRKEGINEWKRNRLLSAGASMIIPDFAGYDKLIEYITM
ncbi:MAG: SIS domain-containing protein [Ruminococcaceae bacterium]|nr:SIS domain-containing protein [Oscillospiraceae bacterium]